MLACVFVRIYVSEHLDSVCLEPHKITSSKATNFWSIVLLPQLCSVAHSPLSAPPPGHSLGMHLLPRNNATAFYKLLKTNLYCCSWVGSDSE